MSTSVHVREVEIHQALGIRRGAGFKLDGLSPGVNLVYGPNGCGKSTTCKVVQELLWPGRLTRPSVAGVVLDGADEWRVDIDAGYVQCYLDGRSDALPEFGPSEGRRRYHLGLRDLIIDDNEDFAKKIADASQGGYDLDAAAENLGFRRKPKARHKEQKQLQHQRGAVTTARQVQLDIQADTGRLEELSAQLQKAEEADRELARFEEAKEYFEERDRCDELQIELSGFDEGVSRLQGNEKDLLDELSQKERKLSDRRRSEEERVRKAEEQMQAAGLPDGLLEKELLQRLRARRITLHDLEVRIRDQKQRRDEASAEAEKALRALGDDLSEEQLAAIETLENEDLGAFARKVHRVRGERASLELRREWLEKEAPDEVRSLRADNILNGLKALTDWLAAEGGEGGHSIWPTAVVALFAAAFSIALLLFTGSWFWGVGLLIAAALFVIEWNRVRRARVDDRRVHRQSFERLRLPFPTSWKRGDVLDATYFLAELLGKRAIADERLGRLELLELEDSRLVEKEQQLEAERTGLEARLGLALTIDDEWLPVLIGHIARWQSAASKRYAAASALSELERETGVIRSAINEDLAPYGYTRAGSADEAEQQIIDLEGRINDFRRAAGEAADAVRVISETIEPDLVQVQEERRQLFERLEITPEEAYRIDGWFARLEAYLQCTNDLDRRKAVLADKESSFADRPELLQVGRIELDQHIAKCKKQSERRNELSQEIGGIKRSIEDAKAGHALTDALEAYEGSLAELEVARDENCRAVTGAVLTDWVRRVAVERSRPAVFQRAKELFVRFTRGSLHLEMDDRSNPPAFVARCGDQPTQSLNELSDGERIQLMAAVRLAFLEQDESKPLPLLVDEVLGTSDDGRSGVIIDTMIEIARAGRQIFYCTAQLDEVGKWLARLEEEDVDYSTFDLAELRKIEAARSNPLEIIRIEKSPPPPPNGMGYDEYGEALRVPGIDPMSGSVDGLHLWHLLDDAHTLHDLLCKDITTWGQLRTLLEHGENGLLDSLNGTPDRARAAARAIERACEAYRIGRGKPVDRAALEDSGFVSDTFIDDVSDLCYRYDGNAEALLSALESGEVPRFWKKNIEGLRDYLEANEYMAMRDPLSPEEVRIRIMGGVAHDVQRGLLSPGFVDRLVGMF